MLGFVCDTTGSWGCVKLANYQNIWISTLHRVYPSRFNRCRYFHWVNSFTLSWSYRRLCLVCRLLTWVQVTKLSLLRSDRKTDKEGKINLAASASNTDLCALLTDRVTQVQCNVCCYFCVVAHPATILSGACSSQFRGRFHYNYNGVNYLLFTYFVFPLVMVDWTWWIWVAGFMWQQTYSTFHYVVLRNY